MEWSKTRCNKFESFCSVAYTHVPEELRKKLDDRSEKCIFEGYSDASKEHKLYSPITKKKIVSRDVKFIEDKSWYEQDNGTTQGQPTPHSFELQDVDQPRERLPRLEVPIATRENQVQQVHSPSSSSNSDPTLAQLGNQKTKIIREICEQRDKNE